jgi:hypothetical protein
MLKHDMTEFNLANKSKKQKGYSKEYLNGLRKVGCRVGHCRLCRISPTNKSRKHEKGSFKHEITLSEYLSEYFDTYSIE